MPNLTTWTQIMMGMLICQNLWNSVWLFQHYHGRLKRRASLGRVKALKKSFMRLETLNGARALVKRSQSGRSCTKARNSSGERKRSVCTTQYVCTLCDGSHLLDVRMSISVFMKMGIMV